MHVPPAAVVVLTCLLAAPTLAQTVVSESFDGGSNEGSWNFGTGGQTISPLNGNPGAFLQDLTLVTHNPRASTGFGVASAFRGDYRAGRVTSLGIDLVVLDTDLTSTDGRKVTLLLLNDNGTPFNLGDDWGAYFVGPDDVPDPGVTSLLPGGAGWTSYDFDVPSQATTLPPGWTFVGPASKSWDDLVQDVDVVQFAFGDPTLIYLVVAWDVGLDNPRVTRTTWEDLGGGLAGVAGTPELSGEGALFAGDAYAVTLAGALPNATGWLVLGLAPLGAPFKGGTLWPTPDVLAPLPTGPAGGFTLPSAWPAGVPSGAQLVLQVWVSDPSGPAGFSASNGLLATAP